jgi:hypothetical protein
MLTKFHDDWFRHSEVDRGGYKYTGRMETAQAYFRKIG